MLAWFDVDGAQDVVYTTYFYRLVVNGTCPSWLVYLREYDDTTIL